MKLSKGFLAALSWAIAIIIARFVLRGGENAYNVAFWTTVLATPFWLFLFSKRAPELKTMAKKNWWILIGMGLVSTIGVNITEAFALKYSSAIKVI